MKAHCGLPYNFQVCRVGVASAFLQLGGLAAWRHVRAGWLVVLVGLAVFGVDGGRRER